MHYRTLPNSPVALTTELLRNEQIEGGAHSLHVYLKMKSQQYLLIVQFFTVGTLKSRSVENRLLVLI